MALPIRPTSAPATPSVGPSDAARAAQRAFFDAAMGKAATPAPVQSSAPTPPVAPTAPVAQASAQPSAPLATRTISQGAPLPKVDTTTPPDPDARPGSRLNIRV
jgi:hypothetical protein